MTSGYLHPSKDLDSFEELTISAGYHTKLCIDELPGLAEYRETLEELSEPRFLSTGFAGHIPCFYYECKDDDILPYAKGFIRTKDRGGCLDIAAAGVFTVENVAVSSGVKRWGDAPRYSTRCAVRELKNPVPFLFTHDGVDESGLVKLLEDKSKHLRSLSGSVNWLGLSFVQFMVESSFYGIMGTMGGCAVGNLYPDELVAVTALGLGLGVGKAGYDTLRESSLGQQLKMKFFNSRYKYGSAAELYLMKQASINS